MMSDEGPKRQVSRVMCLVLMLIMARAAAGVRMELRGAVGSEDQPASQHRHSSLQLPSSLAAQLRRMLQADSRSVFTVSVFIDHTTYADVDVEQNLDDGLISKTLDEVVRATLGGAEGADTAVTCSYSTEPKRLGVVCQRLTNSVADASALVAALPAKAAEFLAGARVPCGSWVVAAAATGPNTPPRVSSVVRCSVQDTGDLTSPALCCPSSAAATAASITAQMIQLPLLLIFGRLDMTQVATGIDDLRAAVAHVTNTSLVQPRRVTEVSVGQPAPGAPGSVLLPVTLTVVPGPGLGRDSTTLLQLTAREVGGTLVDALNRDAIISSRFGGQVTIGGPFGSSSSTTTSAAAGTTPTTSSAHRTRVIWGVVGGIACFVLLAAVLLVWVVRIRGSTGAREGHLFPRLNEGGPHAGLVHLEADGDGVPLVAGTKRRARLANGSF